MISYLYIVGGIILFIAFLRIKKGMSNQKKILNALYAKYTFNTLDKQLQNDVLQVTFIILHKGGYTDPQSRFNNFSEIQKYGFIALALAELNIPSIDKKYEWQYVERPQIIPKNIEKQIETAEYLFLKDNGVIVKLEK